MGWTVKQKIVVALCVPLLIIAVLLAGYSIYEILQGGGG